MAFVILLALVSLDEIVFLEIAICNIALNIKTAHAELQVIGSAEPPKAGVALSVPYSKTDSGSIFLRDNSLTPGKPYAASKSALWRGFLQN